MAHYGVQTTVEFFVIDTANGKGKTGDNANLTLRWVKDGTSAATTNSSSEVDSTNAPGLYKVTLTATEMQCQSGTLHGKSSTSGVELVPRHVDPIRVPNVDFGTSGGLADYTTLASTYAAVDTEVAAIKAKTDNLPSGFPTNFSSLSIDSNGRVKVQGTINKNAAFSNFEFLMKDSTNHAPATGKTVTVSRSIDGASFSGGTLGSVTEVGNGLYKCDLGAGDLNGNIIIFRAVATGCDDTIIPIIPLQ